MKTILLLLATSVLSAPSTGLDAEINAEMEAIFHLHHRAATIIYVCGGLDALVDTAPTAALKKLASDSYQKNGCSFVKDGLDK